MQLDSNFAILDRSTGCWGLRLQKVTLSWAVMGMNLEHEMDLKDIQD